MTEVQSGFVFCAERVPGGQGHPKHLRSDSDPGGRPSCCGKFRGPSPREHQLYSVTRCRSTAWRCADLRGLHRVLGANNPAVRKVSLPSPPTRSGGCTSRASLPRCPQRPETKVQGRQRTSCLQLRLPARPASASCTSKGERTRQRPPPAADLLPSSPTCHCTGGLPPGGQGPLPPGGQGPLPPGGQRPLPPGGLPPGGQGPPPP